MKLKDNIERCDNCSTLIKEGSRCYKCKGYNIFELVGELPEGEHLIQDEVRGIHALVTVNKNRDLAILLNFIDTDELGHATLINYAERTITLI